MHRHPWVQEFGAGVTVCDTEGIIIEMNDRSAQMFREQGGRALLGSNVLDCHPEPARTKLRLLMEQRQANTYTTERSGRRKLIHQAPWYRDGQYAGFVEIVLALPDALPHFIRDATRKQPEGRFEGTILALTDPADRACPDISDGDIYEAMKEIPGYLDITPADLKEIYRHAFRHALERVSRPLKATEIMTRTVHHVRVDTPLKDVAELMARQRISGVPVLDETGRVAGVISEKDFLSRMGAPGTAHVMGVIAACLGGKGCVAMPLRGTAASDIMAAPATSVREDTSTLEILEIFTTRHINRVPVIDGSGRLAGIVSRADLLRPQAAPRE